MGHLYAELTVSLTVLNISQGEMCIFTDKQGRIKVPDIRFEFDVMCFRKEREKSRAARLKAPVAGADRQTELMWKECKWNSANFESFKSLFCHL